MNILKTFLFTIVSIIAITTIYGGFNILFFYLLDFLSYLSTIMSVFSLYILIFFIGLAVISIVWGVFKILSSLIVFKVAKITPYKNYAGTLIMILALICTFLSIWDFWYNIGWQTFATGFCIIIINILALSLFSSLCNASYKALFKEEDNNPSTNLNIEILDLTEEQYNAMKLMYGNEISRGEALKKVNTIRAFKSIK